MTKQPSQVITLRIDSEMEALLDTAMEMEPCLSKSEIIREGIKEYINTRFIEKTGENWSINVPVKLAELYTLIMESGFYASLNDLIVEAMRGHVDFALSRGDNYSTQIKKAIEQKNEAYKLHSKNQGMKIYRQK